MIADYAMGQTSRDELSTSLSEHFEVPKEAAVVSFFIGAGSSRRRRSDPRSRRTQPPACSVRQRSRRSCTASSPSRITAPSKNASISASRCCRRRRRWWWGGRWCHAGHVVRRGDAINLARGTSNPNSGTGRTGSQPDVGRRSSAARGSERCRWPLDQVGVPDRRGGRLARHRVRVGERVRVHHAWFGHPADEWEDIYVRYDGDDGDDDEPVYIDGPEYGGPDWIRHIDDDTEPGSSPSTVPQRSSTSGATRSVASPARGTSPGSTGTQSPARIGRRQRWSRCSTTHPNRSSPSSNVAAEHPRMAETIKYDSARKPYFDEIAAALSKPTHRWGRRPTGKRPTCTRNRPTPTRSPLLSSPVSTSNNAARPCRRQRSTRLPPPSPAPRSRCGPRSKGWSRCSPTTRSSRSSRPARPGVQQRRRPSRPRDVRVRVGPSPTPGPRSPGVRIHRRRHRQPHREPAPVRPRRVGVQRRRRRSDHVHGR